MSLTNGGKPFNVVDNTSNGYKTSCIDRWRPIKAYIIEHGSVTKRGIKATIKATMARCCGTIYKHSIYNVHIIKKYAITLISYTLLKLPHADCTSKILW